MGKCYITIIILIVLLKMYILIHGPNFHISKTDLILAAAVKPRIIKGHEPQGCMKKFLPES